MLAVVQSAIYSRLTGYAGLTALLAGGASGVHDFVPQDDNAFPFVTLGDLSASEFDADDRTGADVRVVVNTWSRYRGKKEATEIMDQVYAALHRYDDLAVSGYNTVDVQWDGLTNIMRDPDGLTFHGVQTFRVTIIKAA